MSSTEIQGADSSPASIPTIGVPTPGDPFEPGVLDQIARLLPSFLATRRWFRAKARLIDKVVIDDIVTFSQVNSLFVLNVKYIDGGADTYLLPLALSIADDSVRNSPLSETLAILRTGETERPLYSAFANPSFRGSVLTAFADNRTFQGRHGEFLFHRIAGSGVSPKDLHPTLESSVSRAEQSNTSVIYGDKFILKLFRKIEEGINPDIEVGTFLTERGFANTPAVVGTLEYRKGQSHETYAAGLLGVFVPNRGDAWKYTLDSLSGFFSRALVSPGSPDRVPAHHPLQLADHSFPENARHLIGPYLESARLLGQRTAEMHQALSRGNAKEFVPEPATPADSARLYSEMQRQADLAFDVLRLKQLSLPAESAAAAQRLLAHEHDIRHRFSNLRDSPLAAARIRFHGDYHLGQVLYTGSDFMIIDFEGEPARPLEERREKTFALRDVAGMVRSFQYAAYAALFGQVSGVSTARTDSSTIAQWSAFWYAWVSAAFLKGYFDTARDVVFVTENTIERRRLLDAFLLHKALYEVAYELNNRPDWLRIPLHGILDLIA